MFRSKKPASPFRYFNSSPEVIRLVVMMYVRFPLSLRNVEDLLFERGIDTRANATDFVDHIIDKFPFRIREIRTDNGHKFQAKFHWHVEDLGIRHAYIKRGTPQLKGKVERSLRSDGQEFYQLLSYKGDVDLEAKLDQWEHFYNFHRPHGAFNGKRPYEAIRERLSSHTGNVSPITRFYSGAARLAHRGRQVSHQLSWHSV
jgi:hypothetical protein